MQCVETSDGIIAAAAVNEPPLNIPSWTKTTMMDNLSWLACCYIYKIPPFASYTRDFFHAKYA